MTLYEYLFQKIKDAADRGRADPDTGMVLRKVLNAIEIHERSVLEEFRNDFPNLFDLDLGFLRKMMDSSLKGEKPNGE